MELFSEYVRGASELIVEISGSSSSRDLGIKLHLYRRAGVREYLTVLIKPRQVVWRQLVRGRYKEVARDEDGMLRSAVFPAVARSRSDLGSKGITSSCRGRRNPLPRARSLRSPSRHAPEEVRTQLVTWIGTSAAGRLPERPE